MLFLVVVCICDDCTELFASVRMWRLLRLAPITLQIDSCYNLDPQDMICINFQMHNL